MLQTNNLDQALRSLEANIKFSKEIRLSQKSASRHPPLQTNHKVTQSGTPAPKKTFVSQHLEVEQPKTSSVAAFLADSGYPPMEAIRQETSF